MSAYTLALLGTLLGVVAMLVVGALVGKWLARRGRHGRWLL